MLIRVVMSGRNNSMAPNWNGLTRWKHKTLKRKTTDQGSELFKSKTFTSKLEQFVSWVNAFRKKKKCNTLSLYQLFHFHFLYLQFSVKSSI